jgi:hypothetical protein
MERRGLHIVELDVVTYLAATVEVVVVRALLEEMLLQQVCPSSHEIFGLYSSRG